MTAEIRDPAFATVVGPAPRVERLATGFDFSASSAGSTGSTPIAARIVSGNFAGLAVASTTLTRPGVRSLKAQAVCGSVT